MAEFVEVEEPTSEKRFPRLLLAFRRPKSDITNTYKVLAHRKHKNMKLSHSHEVSLLPKLKMKKYNLDVFYLEINRCFAHTD